MTRTQSIEQKWAEDGPDWSDPTEVLAYSDWLEEQGMDAPAAGARWLNRKGKRPSTFSPQFSWYNRSELLPDSDDLPDGLLPLEAIYLPSEIDNSGFAYFDSESEAYMAVINELKSHPEKVHLLKGTP